MFPPLAVLLTAPVLARSLGVEGRGDLAAATAPFLLGLAVCTLGLPEAVSNALARRRKISRATWATIALILTMAGAAATLFIYFAAPMLAAGSNSEIGILMTIATAATIPGLLVALLRGTASGLELWNFVAIERGLNGLIRIVCIGALAIGHELTVVSAAAVTVSAPVLSGLVYLPLAKSTLAGSDTDGFEQMPKLFSFGMKAWLGSVAGILLMRIDQFLLLPLGGAFQLGIYSVAVNVGEVPLIINSATREVIFSADAAKHDNAKAGAAARITFLSSALFSGVILLPISWWLPAVFGGDFAAAIPVAIVVNFAMLIGIPGSIAGSALGARGRPELRSFAIASACFLNVVLVIFLVPMAGAMGAALATLAGNIFSSNLCIWFAVRNFGFSWGDFYRVRRADIGLVRNQLRVLRNSRNFRSFDRGGE